jgi:amino acid transporter
MLSLFRPRCNGLHCPGCGVGGEIPIMPILIVFLVFVVLTALTEAARSAITATHVLMTDIIDGVLIFCLSMIGLILIALILWLSSHAGRIMWKYRGNYGLRNPSPITPSSQDGIYFSNSENGIEYVETEEVNGVHVPKAINPPPAFNSTDEYLESLLDEDLIPVKSRFSLRRD